VALVQWSNLREKCEQGTCGDSVCARNQEAFIPLQLSQHFDVIDPETVHGDALMHADPLHPANLHLVFNISSSFGSSAMIHAP
jgi:hypothetical protein